MKDVLIISVVVVGLMTLGMDYFLLETLIENQIFESRKQLWIFSGISLPVMLILPFFMLNPERREKAGDVAVASGLALLDVVRYIGIGVLIFIGWHVTSNVFNAF